MNALEQRHRKRSANREAPARRGDLRVGTSRRGPAGAIVEASVEAATKMLRVPEFFEETGYLTLSHREVPSWIVPIPKLRILNY